MGEDTKIEWCDHSWSPWRGCTKVSPGCAHCYAETLSKRNPAVLGHWGKGKPRVLAKNWGDPVRWNKAGHVCGECGKTTHGGTCFHGQRKGTTHRPTVFPSLCDWLDDEVDIEWLARFLQLIHATPNLRWLMLTKRPELWRGRMIAAHKHAVTHAEDTAAHADFRNWLSAWVCPVLEHSKCAAPPLNVWVGTSVEDQTRADVRIPALLRIPAVGRFLSVEPLLGPVSLTAEGFIPADENGPNRVGYMVTPDDGESGLKVAPADALRESGIGWVIIGGESGRGARQCNVEWIRSIVRQCKDASVPCFVKQLGAVAVEHQCGEDGNPLGNLRLALNHPKGGDPAEWPADLRVREFPEGLR